MSKYLDEIKHQMDMMDDKTCSGYMFLQKIMIEEQGRLVHKDEERLAAEHVKQNRLESGQDELEKDNERYLDNEGLER